MKYDCDGDQKQVSLAAHRRTTKQAVLNAWVRGYVAAVAEFARFQTTPKRVLSFANITRAKAVASGVYESDLRELRGLWAKPAKGRR